MLSLHLSVVYVKNTPTELNTKQPNQFIVVFQLWSKYLVGKKVAPTAECFPTTKEALFFSCCFVRFSRATVFCNTILENQSILWKLMVDTQRSWLYIVYLLNV